MTVRPAAFAVTLITSGLVLAACASNNVGLGSVASGSGVSSATSTAPAGSASTPATTPSSSPSASATPAVTVKPAPSTPVRQVSVTSADGKRSYDIAIWWQVNTADCAGHSYGTPVIQYLTANPCHGMTRLLATTTVGGKAVGFAQTSLSFIGNAPQVYQTAGSFAALEEKDGTGSVNDLLREGYRLPTGPASLPSPDAFDVESQDSGVTIVDAFYLSGPTPNNAAPLVQLARDIYLQF